MDMFFVWIIIIWFICWFVIEFVARHKRSLFLLDHFGRHESLDPLWVMSFLASKNPGQWINYLQHRLRIKIFFVFFPRSPIELIQCVHLLSSAHCLNWNKLLDYLCSISFQQLTKSTDRSGWSLTTRGFSVPFTFQHCSAFVRMAIHWIESIRCCSFINVTQFLMKLTRMH